jgi:hypothetical protein
MRAWYALQLASDELIEGLDCLHGCEETLRTHHVEILRGPFSGDFSIADDCGGEHVMIVRVGQF